MTSKENAPAAGDPSFAQRADERSHELVLEFEAFAWEALSGEAGEMSVSPEELATFAVLYYLADHDSGRTARQLPRAGRRKTDADRSGRRRNLPTPPQIGQR